MKAHVIGFAGSGKTTLGRWLADRTSTSSIDLDGVVYDAFGRERSAEDIAQRLATVRLQSQWVTEGAYHEAWLTQHLDECDLIVWLDLPVRICLCGSSRVMSGRS